MNSADWAIQNFDVTQIELRGFSRTLAELEWLLLVLVLLYFVIPSATIGNPWNISLAMSLFAAFIIVFRYANFFSQETTWKLAIETWAMIIFITLVVANTGGINSPLLNLYLLVIIASAVTLGKLITVLEFLLITAIYAYLAYSVRVEGTFSFVQFSEIMTQFAPFLLVGYLTTMLTADVHYGREVLQMLSETDDLTGLRNRRTFSHTISQEEKKAKRYGRSFSVMMIDADNLKQVNDQFGHSAGDQLLKNLSDNIQHALRDTDVLVRYGGDEFVAILPETDIVPAQEAGERIRAAVENTSFDVNGNRIASTVSIGIANYPVDAEHTNGLLDKADQAMYHSKEAGRNKVSAYHSIQHG